MIQYLVINISYVLEWIMLYTFIILHNIILKFSVPSEFVKSKRYDWRVMDEQLWMTHLEVGEVGKHFQKIRTLRVVYDIKELY